MDGEATNVKRPGGRGESPGRGHNHERKARYSSHTLLIGREAAWLESKRKVFIGLQTDVAGSGQPSAGLCRVLRSESWSGLLGVSESGQERDRHSLIGLPLSPGRTNSSQERRALGETPAETPRHTRGNRNE